MFRTVCGGGKGGGSSYDPQIGIAAGQSAAVAGRAEAFAEQYYNNVVTPMLQQQSAAATKQADASIESQGKLNKLYDLNAESMAQAKDRYNKLGIPAEDKYYKMVSDYSEDAEFERQAQLAKGDLGQAFTNQKGAFSRSLSSLGIDPSSPAAVSAMSDMAVRNAAMEAGAMNRARNGARTLGMTLTSDAANFGRGGQSGILQYGAAAQGNTTGAFGVAQGALQGANGALGAAAGAGAGVMAGYSTAAGAYGNNLDAYSKLGSADIQAKAANDPMAGFGQLVGTLGSAWIKSDRRTKQNLRRVGEYRPGVGKYEFNYIGDDTPHVGAIAQEVMHVLPQAVREGHGGMLEVNYAELR